MWILKKIVNNLFISKTFIGTCIWKYESYNSEKDIFGNEFGQNLELNLVKLKK